MKARELIERLGELDPEEEVYILQPSHDYWRTTCAVPATDVFLTDTEWSEYHRKLRIRDRDDEESERPDKNIRAVIG